MVFSESGGGGGEVLNRQNLFNLTKFAFQWSLKEHFGQWIDIQWICWSRISQGIYTASKCRVVIGNASCLLSPGICV